MEAPGSVGRAVGVASGWLGPNVISLDSGALGVALSLPSWRDRPQLAAAIAATARTDAATAIAVRPGRSPNLLDPARAAAAASAAEAPPARAVSSVTSGLLFRSSAVLRASGGPLGRGSRRGLGRRIDQAHGADEHDRDE